MQFQTWPQATSHHYYNFLAPFISSIHDIIELKFAFAFSQNLLTDEGSVDVRIRCKDHQPLDGLGAHQLVLAAASPDFLRKVLSGKKMFLNQALLNSLIS